MRRFVGPMIGLITLLVAVIILGNFVPLTVEHPNYDQGCYCMGGPAAGYTDPNWDYETNQPKTATAATLTSMTYTTATMTSAKIDTSALTEQEKYWLTFMREEEKLARDVYSLLGDKWNNQLLKDMVANEQNDMDELEPLLDNHGVPDPAAGKGPGVFTNSDLQKLYNELTRQGSVSLAEALKVGVLVEQKDITDLREGIATANHEDVKAVYDNLLKGSTIHLNAFQFELSKQSATPSQESGWILATESIVIVVIVVAAVALVGAYFFLHRRRKK